LVGWQRTSAWLRAGCIFSSWEESVKFQEEDRESDSLVRAAIGLAEAKIARAMTGKRSYWASIFADWKGLMKTEMQVESKERELSDCFNEKQKKWWWRWRLERRGNHWEGISSNIYFQSRTFGFIMLALPERQRRYLVVVKDYI
jgi:hypothetical protein